LGCGVGMVRSVGEGGGGGGGGGVWGPKLREVSASVSGKTIPPTPCNKMVTQFLKEKMFLGS